MIAFGKMEGKWSVLHQPQKVIGKKKKKSEHSYSCLCEKELYVWQSTPLITEI